MRFPDRKISLALFAVSLLVTSCVSPDSNSSEGAFAGGVMTQGVGANTGAGFATGVSSGAIIGATVFIIAKHEATERQRRIAEERARATQARMTAQVQRNTVSVAAAPQMRTGAATRNKPATKLPRYIAVDTVKDERTSPKAKKSVMIWDTQAERVIGNDVYDVSTPPPVGSTARFETYAAQYVGSGI
jgi:hypothetical protein